MKQTPNTKALRTVTYVFAFSVLLGLFGLAADVLMTFYAGDHFPCIIAELNGILVLLS